MCREFIKLCQECGQGAVGRKGVVFHPPPGPLSPNSGATCCLNSGWGAASAGREGRASPGPISNMKHRDGKSLSYLKRKGVGGWFGGILAPNVVSRRVMETRRLITTRNERRSLKPRYAITIAQRPVSKLS